MLSPAIFLSYASQDAETARRLCDALRAVDLDVWFDQSELRGGDAWDASIRKQIKKCSLFVPIISDNTNAREEGYFRPEWKLAVDRSHLMADNKAFFFPVILGDVAEPLALVPDKFRERQWTRLGTQISDDAATQAFAERIAKLTTGAGFSSKNASSSPSDKEFVSAIPAPPAVAADATPSIAVLAFANRSASADDEYFSDGLADELLNVLAKIKGLRVAARTSAFSCKGKSDDVATIGQKLNVATVLEGSVRKSGNRVRISVQRIKVDDGFQLWGETYDRTLADIFAVQDDIAQSVVTELRATLLGEATAAASIASEIRASTRTRSENPEVLRSIMQARFYREKRRPADIQRAITFAEEAIALDPQYAQAHACLADTLQLMSVYGAGFGADAHTMLACSARARTSAEAALALDANLVLPHITPSWLAAVVVRDRAAAMREARLAVALAPDDAEALRTLAHRLIEHGQFAECEALFVRAIELSPLWLQLRINYSLAAQWAGQFDEALRRARDAIAIDESYWPAQWQLASTLNSVGDDAGAAEAAARAQELRGNNETAALLRQQFAQGGWQGYLEAVINAPIHTLTRLSKAWALIELGRTNDVLATLEAMVESFDRHANWLKHGPGLTPLHTDPRFRALLKRAGFTE